MELGEKIKQLRLQCDLTQEELASRCELSKGYISQLENDLTSPSIATLKDILTAVGSSLKEFFSEVDVEEKLVFTEQDFIEKVTDTSTLNWLVPNAQKNAMEPIHLVLKPFSKTETDFPHEGEEFGYVLQGEIILVVGKKKYVVKKGESFYFEADKLHHIENNKDSEAVLIWISTPPTF
ncbi:MAG: cupin domain-containing protein [Clostridia bacterium]|nr:cupin domain-containing protein [Clostridia bacterium]MBQ3495477.1 cupin domain-containing protein [Clostridia bacterium]MBQ4587491.1 cupin domain-containing protein [Clostridia bacterium]MBQ6883125.1 cupin domain-containing protein [Clostridia bacterium]MBR2933185.1 cupin domain-containing protein [Clostridia bacterium]